MSHTLFAYEVSGIAIFNIFILSSIPQHGLCYLCLKKCIAVNIKMKNTDRFLLN